MDHLDVVPRHRGAISWHDMSPSVRQPRPQLDDDDYIRLAELRHGQRQFMHWSARQAERAGITPTQHQLLLGLRAWIEPEGPTMQDVAARRVRRAPVGQVLVEVTELGARRLQALTESHLRELAALAPTMSALWDAVAEVARDGAEA
jgi:hypothetical protein